jgi:hypothetical protein
MASQMMEVWKGPLTYQLCSDCVEVRILISSGCSYTYLKFLKLSPVPCDWCLLLTVGHATSSCMQLIFNLNQDFNDKKKVSLYCLPTSDLWNWRNCLIRSANSMSGIVWSIWRIVSLNPCDGFLTWTLFTHFTDIQVLPSSMVAPGIKL